MSDREFEMAVSLRLPLTEDLTIQRATVDIVAILYFRYSYSTGERTRSATAYGV